MSERAGLSGRNENTAERYPYATEVVDCNRCYGDGEYEDDLWILVRCYQCGGRGTIEVCASCGDNGEECGSCGC